MNKIKVLYRCANGHGIIIELEDDKLNAETIMTEIGEKIVICAYCGDIVSYHKRPDQSSDYF